MKITVTNIQEEDGYKVEHFSIEVDGRIGQGSIIVSNNEPAYLERIDIDVAHRNKGFGTAALYAIKEKYGDFYAAPDNPDCQRLLERIGTETYGYEVDQGYGVYEI